MRSFLALVMVLLSLGLRNDLLAQSSPIVWGVVERLYRDERLMVRTSDDRLEEVRARGSHIQLSGGEYGRWDDLRQGQDVEVFGDARGERTVVASLIRITGAAQRAAPEDRRGDQRYRDAEDGGDRQEDRERRTDRVGIIAAVDWDRESFRLARDPRPVELFNETELRFESGRRAALRDLRVGETVRVRGTNHGGRIVAEQVTLLRSTYQERYRARDHSDRGTVVLIGTVRGPTYLLNRRVKVRTNQGDIAVDVERDTPITKYGERISVHELERGDRVRIAGDWVGEGRLRPRRIDTQPPRRPRE